MTDAIKLNKEVTKGKKAETILEDELFKEAIGALKVNYMNQIINTSYKDSDGRTAIWIAIHQLDKVQYHQYPSLKNHHCLYHYQYMISFLS